MRSHRLHRLIGYLVIVIILFFATETQRTQREDVEIVFQPQITQINPYQDEYEKMLYPTVRISTPSGTGSGVIISHRDTEKYIYILSASHVVGNENKVTIELFYPKNIKIDADVVITDTTKDLVLLRITNPPQSPFDKGGRKGGFYNATLAPKDYTPYLFSPVWAVGCSLGLKPRPSFGHITAINEQLAINNAQFSLLTAQCPFWEISSPILPGNSGGPVYDARTFEVIGIAVWVKVYQYQLVTTMAGVVPIQTIYEFLNHKDTKNTK